MDCNKADAVGAPDPLVMDLSSGSNSQDYRITGVGGGLSPSVVQPSPQALHEKHCCPPGPVGSRELHKPLASENSNPNLPSPTCCLCSFLSPQ